MRLNWVAVFIFLLSAAIWAAEPKALTLAPDAPKTAVSAPEEKKGLISLEGGVDVTNAYFFRGYLAEDNGFIVQPYATLAFNIEAEVGGFTISPYIGTWNSMHSENNGMDDPKWWYETDAIAGVNFEKGPFTLGFVYTYYYSPSGSFRSSHEVGVTLAYDDSEHGLLPFAINPRVGLYRELDRSANLAGGEPGTYLELGIEPYLLKTKSLEISFPTTLGLSISDYYTDSSGDNEILGYGSIGLKGKIPLTSSLSLTGEVTYLRLFADSAEAANGGDDDEFIGRVGLQFSL
jgi:hypothetical protein